MMGSRDMADMDVPVKDVVKNDYLNINEVKERQIVTSLNRNDLEDRYLRLREAHLDLKKKSHSQEEKMKQMATKLLRLVKDRKRLEEDGTGVDIESRQKVEELQSHITSLERQNNQLKSKLMVVKQQLQSQGKKNTPYDHVKARINTGISPKKGASARQQRIKEQIRVQGSPPPQRNSPRGPMPVLPQPRYGHSLLEEARLENRDLETAVGNYEEQLQQYEEQVELLKMQIKQKEIDHEEDMQKLQQRVSDSQRTKLQENIELVKLQREVKDKVAQLQRLQGKYQNLEELLNKVKLSHEQVLEEMEGLTNKLKDEKAKSSRLENEIKQGDTSSKVLEEKDEIISDLRAEIELLKDAHQNLLHSTFDAERERKYRAKEREYQIRIAQLEATIKADVSDKNEVLDKLSSERDLCDNSRTELRELQVKYFALKEKYDDLTEKLKFFTSESSADLEEVQEALLLVKTRKEKASHDLTFLEKVDEVVNNDAVRKMQELQAAHAETINELEKTRNMLLMQHNINKDYQKEVEETTKRMEELQRESDTRVKEYAQLLDIRAQRIKKLESQLRDVAYGTKQYKIRDVKQDVTEDEDLDVQLERGQNIFEIHVGKMNITPHGFEAFDNSQPTSFISYEFFEYELQATSVAHGASCDFNHTSQYTVQVDDFFLHYLQKESMTFEMHQAFGTEYRTLAKAAIRFNEIISRSHGRLHGTVFLVDTSGKDIASVEYWMRLRVPMEQALRLYKERTKALGYITSNDLQKLENPHEKSLKDSGINELKIGIIQCLNLKSNVKDVQPCPYCVYKFFDFADHDTEIVENSNSPQFHDFRTFPVPMTQELDNYLKNSSLLIYIFDDVDPEPASYIGMASVPLITISQDKVLKGKFELKNINDKETGTIDVRISWEYTYLPASAKSIRTFPEPSVHVGHGVIEDAVVSQRSQGVMQSMISSGKLFEPHIVGTPNTTQVEEELMVPIHETNQQISKESLEKPVQEISKESSSDKSLKAKAEKNRPTSASSSTSSSSSSSTSKEEKKKKKEKDKRKEKKKKKEKQRKDDDEDDKDDDDDEEKEKEKKKDKKKNEKYDDVDFDEDAEKDTKKSKTNEKLKPIAPVIDDAALKNMNVDELALLIDGDDGDVKHSLQEIEESESDQEFLEEELRRTVETPETPANDTMFQEVLSEDEEIPEKIVTEHEIGDSSQASDTTEDDVIVSSSLNRSVSLGMSNVCSITVTISSLTLFDKASILSMDNIKQLFVSYKFLDYDPEQLETPISLPKPKANRPISFNFKKVFHVDAEQHGNSRQHLMHLLMPDHPNEGRLFFTVVSDPVDDEEEDCDDVGIAYVDLIQILREGKDLIDTDIDVYDLLGSEGELIGSLTVSVEAVDALRSLYSEG